MVAAFLEAWGLIFVLLVLVVNDAQCLFTLNILVWCCLRVSFYWHTREIIVHAVHRHIESNVNVKNNLRKYFHFKNKNKSMLPMMSWCSHFLISKLFLMLPMMSQFFHYLKSKILWLSMILLILYYGPLLRSPELLEFDNICFLIFGACRVPSPRAEFFWPVRQGGAM